MLLLDVYLSSLRIIIPANAGDKVRTAARNLAEPQTMTNAQRIMISYPIYTADNLPEDIARHNLIIFCSYDEHDITDYLPIRCSENACWYREKQWKGEYCIMQVFSAPYNERQTILYIIYNNEACLNKVLFLRKMILPFGMSGFHQYLNRSGLVWNNGMIYIVNDIF